MIGFFKQIRGFSSPGEYQRFLNYLSEQLALSNICELAVDPQYSRGEIRGGRWFEEVQIGEVWRLIEPDPPFLGLWEPVVV